MAEMTIRLRIDLATGKRDIIVSLSSDADALPHEHEQQHSALVDKLIQGGIVKAGELGRVIVEREEKESAGQETPTVEEQRQAEAQGN